ANPSTASVTSLKDEPKSMFRKIMANNDLVNALLLGGTDDEVRAAVNKGRIDFEAQREKYLLYPAY
ncbi:MAG: hypothetical protein ACO323_07785, partial [Candidatus Kapaibacteriota bacterium]